MSLRDAVLEIAEQMEQDAGEFVAGHDYAGEGLGKQFAFYARQIRSAVKASGAESSQAQTPELDGGVILQAHGCNPDGPARAQQKLAEARRLERAVEREEGSGVRMVEILDGSNDGLCEMHPVPTSMQVGQALDIGRRVFVLTRLDNGTLQLHLHAAETERRFGAKS